MFFLLLFSFDHVFFNFFFLGCRLETKRHKIGSRTKGICSLNSYFYQWQLRVMSPPRHFTNLMCIICKILFYRVMSSYTAATCGRLWKHTIGGKNCTPYSWCDRVPPNHVRSRTFSDRPHPCALTHLLGMSPQIGKPPTANVDLFSVVVNAEMKVDYTI